MYYRPMVPESFIVPCTYETDKFILLPLTVNNLIKDYDAVMASVKHLKGLMGDTDDWPVGLTIEENLIDLGWHQREFSLKHSFAYSVMSLNREVYLGCCYIYPSITPKFDAQAYYWIRQEYLATGLEARLGFEFKNWLQADWPFQSVNFPQQS